MRNLLKTIILFSLIVSIILTSSCEQKKEEVNPPAGPVKPTDPIKPTDPVNPGTKPLSKIDWGGGSSTSLSYDAEGLLKERITLSPGIRNEYRYEYNAAKKLSKVVTNVSGVSEYYYDEEGYLIRVDEINGVVSHYRYRLVYDTQNRLSEIIQSEVKKDGGLVQKHKTTYTFDAQGNLAKIQLFVYKAGNPQVAELFRTILYENYDDKVNVDGFLEINPMLPFSLFKNNPGKVTRIDETGFTPNSTFTYSYTYNDKNRPATASVKIEIVGLPNSSSFAIYSYQ